MSLLPSKQIVLLTLVALAACRAPGPGGEGEPLLDGAHLPDIVVEARELSFPPALDGNRTLSGWWPWYRRPGEPLNLLPATDRSRLEIAQVESRPRRLVLEMLLAETARGREVSAGFPGSPDTLTLPLSERLEISLPADLPIGRVPVDLDLGHERKDVVLQKGVVLPALPAGDVTIEGEDLLQSGNSLVDLVRPVTAGARLTGTFVPPQDARSDQSFRLIVEHEGSDPGQRAFTWHPRWWRSGGERTLDVDLGATADAFVRIRLIASGEGPAARWRGLRLVAPDGVPEEKEEVAEIAPPEGPRLVLLYVLDALRADHVGHLGGPEGITPTLDRLAAEGVTFRNHLSIAPNTVPSMKTMFTGQVWLAGGSWKLPGGLTTLAERYGAAGYRTALLTGNGNVSAWRGLTRGFDHAPRSLHFAAQERWSDEHYNDNAKRCHAATLDWLDRGEPDRAFVHIQTIHPHNPYRPPEPFLSRFAAGRDSDADGRTRTLLDIKRGAIDVDEAGQARIRGLYAGSVAYNDAMLGIFLERLQERYAPGEILLIVTSDHGEELFDHGGVLHGYTLYEEQLRVPLIFWWPGRLQPRAIDAATDSLDLHHTLALMASRAEAVQTGGNSLWPHLLTGSGPSKDVRFAAASSLEGGIFMARSERYKWLWAPREAGEFGMGQGRGRGRDAELVFDLVADPAEHENLVGEDILEAAWLRERGRAWIEVGKAVDPGEDIEEMDEETRRSLRALGYIQ